MIFAVFDVSLIPVGTLRCLNVDTTSISRRDVVDLESYVDATLSCRRRKCNVKSTVKYWVLSTVCGIKLSRHPKAYCGRQTYKNGIVPIWGPMAALWGYHLLQEKTNVKVDDSK